MPAPSASSLESDIRSELKSNGFLTAEVNGKQKTVQFTGAWEQFVKALTKDWATAWKKWQTGHLCCPGNVIPVQGGKSLPFGSGGKIQETVKVDFIIHWPYRRHPRFLEFEKALVDVLKIEFSLFSSSYTVTKLKYSGSSTHTPTTPGVFNVTNEDTAIGKAGVGVSPSNIRPKVEAILKGKGWRTDNPQYKTGLFLDAIDAALNKNFAEWLKKTKITGDTSIGPSSPGVGAGVGTSLVTGKLV